jgi:hypothetical protein
MGSAQLAKEHGHKLTPGREASGMTFGLGLFDGSMKFISGKEL